MTKTTAAHHAEVRRLAAEGMNRTDIATHVGYSVSTVSHIIDRRESCWQRGCIHGDPTGETRHRGSCDFQRFWTCVCAMPRPVGTSLGGVECGRCRRAILKDSVAFGVTGPIKEPT